MIRDYLYVPAKKLASVVEESLVQERPHINYQCCSGTAQRRRDQGEHAGIQDKAEALTGPALPSIMWGPSLGG